MKANEDSLQSEANWDFEHAERRGPVTNRRTVVSVAISSADFRLVSHAAERARMKVSEYIREAAVAKAEAAGTWIMTPAMTISMSGSYRLNDPEETMLLSSSPQPQPILMTSIGSHV